MTKRRRETCNEEQRPFRLLPPRLVPLSAEQERRAVDALAGLLAGFLERQEAASGPTERSDPATLPHPNDHEAA